MTDTKSFETYAANTIVAFHIGRGGRFHNGGHVTYLGQEKIGKYIYDLFLNDEENDENRGQYYDGGGHYVGLSVEDVASGIGYINVDNDYDSTYCQKLADCTEIEMQLIYNEEKDKYYPDDEMLAYLRWYLDIEEEQTEDDE